MYSAAQSVNRRAAWVGMGLSFAAEPIAFCGQMPQLGHFGIRDAIGMKWPAIGGLHLSSQEKIIPKGQGLTL